MALANQTRTFEFEPVDFRRAVADVLDTTINSSDVSLRVVGDGTMAADRHLFGLLLTSVLTHRIEGSLVPGYPSQLVIEATPNGLYIEDDGTRPSKEQRTISTPRDQLLGVDYESVGLSIASRIADLHGWSFKVSDSELGGIRIELGRITWV
jgi:hypothetical protein